MASFLEALRVQRWDDHRYYHHNRVNQSLHVVSAVSFLVAYALAFKDPATAALIGETSTLKRRGSCGTGRAVILLSAVSTCVTTASLMP